MKILMILFLLNIFIIQKPEASTSIKWYTENFYPFNYEENNKINGFSVEIVNEMFRLMGSKDVIEIMPFIRVIENINKIPNTAGFSIYKTDENKNDYYWVGPLAKGSLGFLSDLILRFL